MQHVRRAAAIPAVVVVLAVVGGLLASGCTLESRRGSGSSGPAPVADEDRLEWAKDEPLFVVVRKSCRTLDLYDHGTRIRSYSAVFGLGGGSDKLYEGDRRTPNGLYAVVEKRRHPRWHWFFLLDYPNSTDVHRYWNGVAGGNVPDGAGVGGAVGIHGTDKPELNARGVDWTWGCVSVDNDSIEELAEILPVGTPVLIED